MRPKAFRNAALGGIVLAAAVLGLGLALEFGAWHSSQELTVERLTPVGGHGFAVALGSSVPGLVIANDSPARPRRSTVAMFEDGRPLGPPHSHPLQVNEIGGGRYSHRGGLIISANDNSDPRTNGRHYVIAYRLSLHDWLINGAVALFALATAALLRTYFGGEATWRSVAGDAWRAAANPLPASRSSGRAPLTASLVGAAGGAGVFFALLFAIPLLPVGAAPARLDLIGFYCTVVVALALIGWAALRRPPSGATGRDRRAWKRAAGALLAGLGVALFALPLMETWRSATGPYSTIAGLLPWSDASGYYFGGLHLLETGQIDSWNSRRPINVALAALRLALTGGDLRWTLALNALACALACLVASREVARTLGLGIGMLVFALLYRFATPVLPLMLSEMNGLVFGAVAFAVLWRGVTTRSGTLFALGLLIFALALNARAGPFLIIPALWLWAVLYGGDRLLSWRLPLIGIAATAAGFAVPQVFLALWGGGENVPHANFAQTLYGMAVGGKGWQQIGLDHPKLFNLPEGSRAFATYRIVFDLLLNDPLPFIAFYLAEMIRFPIFLFEVMLPGSAGFGLIAAGTAGVLILVLVRQAMVVGGALAGFLLLSLAGMAVSAPFLIQDGGMRVFIAAGPLLVVFIAAALALACRIGAAVLAGAAAESGDAAETQSHGVWNLPAVAALLTLVVLLAGPPLAMAAWRKSPTAGVDCAAGLRAALFIPGRTGSWLRIHDDARLSHSRAPDVRYSDFGADPGFGNVEIAPLLRRLRPPAALILLFDSLALDERHGFDRSLWAVVEGDAELLGQRQPLGLCGEPIPASESGWAGAVVRVRNLTPLGR